MKDFISSWVILEISFQEILFTLASTTNTSEKSPTFEIGFLPLWIVSNVGSLRTHRTVIAFAKCCKYSSFILF